MIMYYQKEVEKMTVVFVEIKKNLLDMNLDLSANPINKNQRDPLIQPRITGEKHILLVVRRKETRCTEHRYHQR